MDPLWLASAATTSTPGLSYTSAWAGAFTVVSTPQQPKPGTHLLHFLSKLPARPRPWRPRSEEVCLLACRCGALPVRPVGLPSPWPLADRAAQAHYPFLPICNWYPRWPGSPNKLKFTGGRPEAGMGVRMSTLFGFKNIKPKQFIKL